MISFYIDPGTGSALFAILVSGITALVFGIRTLLIKMKTFTKKSERKAMESSSSIPFLIFSDSKRYRTVFEGIIRGLNDRGEKVAYWTFDEDDPLLNIALPNVETMCIGNGNKAFARLNIAKADIVLSTTPHLDVYGWKRSKSVKEYIHIPHSLDGLVQYKMFGLDHYDAVLATGENQVEGVRSIEALRPTIKKKTIVVVGSPQFDVLEDEFKREGRTVENEKKVVLVAPSWGKSGLLNVYGDKLLKALVNTGYEIIVRPHPQSMTSEKDVIEKLQNEFPEVEWNFDNNNFDVQNKSDIMISDFSGIILEYSLVFNKPVIYANADLDLSPYDASWLDREPWLILAIKRLGTPLNENEFDNLKTIIDDNIASVSLKEERQKVKDECYQNRGNSASTICDWLIGERTRLLEENSETVSAPLSSTPQYSAH